MFLGNHQHAVDDKGRVAIPARFREALSGLQDGRLVVTKFKRRGRPCLDVYTMPAWAAFLEKVSSKKRFGRKVSTFESWYVGAAQPVEIDGQGRMLIPPILRGYAELGREIVFAGVTDKFRIWNKELFHQVDSEDERDIFGDPDLLDELEL
jgi:MraZ protein